LVHLRGRPARAGQGERELEKKIATSSARRTRTTPTSDRSDEFSRLHRPLGRWNGIKVISKLGPIRIGLEALDPVLEEDQARDLVARRLRSMAGLDAVVQTRRLAGMLARKGYGPELSMRVIREALAQAPEHQRD
jgi:hypothetical protein